MIRLALFSVVFSLISSFASGQVTPSGQRLRALAPPDFAIGAVIQSYERNATFAPYLSTAAAEFNSLTTTVYLPYGAWPAGDGPIVTKPLTDLITRAESKNQRVHGHVLVFPSENLNSSWFQQLPTNQVEGKLQQFVTKVVSDTRGRVWVWDVVNEAIGNPGEPVDADGVRTGVIRNGAVVPYKEYQAMGQEYIAKSFRWARQADPNAVLIINEAGAEEVNQKSDRLLALCCKLRAQGVPIDGVGFQHHWIDTRGMPDFASIRQNMQRFADAGFDIYITEMDAAATISPNRLTKVPTVAELERQKVIYKSLLELALAQPRCKAFWMWDFADDQSWLQSSPVPFLGDLIPAGSALFAAPFSGGDFAGLRPITAKPAYFGLQEALTHLPPMQFRLTSGWISSSSYLTRNGFQVFGRWVEAPTVRTDTLNANSSSWQSMRWTLEPVMPGVYRIRCVWGANTGYLTRNATTNSCGGVSPGSGVNLTRLNTSFFSQMWNVIPLQNGGFLVQNRWAPQDGFLTRDASGFVNGNWQPGSTLRLFPDADWTSQVWYFSRVPMN